MSTKSELLKLMAEHPGEYLSGQKIGESLHVSRNAVWKAIAKLRQEGYEIESKTGVGHRLASAENLLTDSAVRGALSYPCELHIFDTVDSTNDEAKRRRIGDLPLLLLSDSQTGGRGRLGRSFDSPAGDGLYMTIAFRPEFDLDKALFVTMAAAVAVSRAIETVAGLKPKIKWVNDLFYNNKKVCGILTEAQTNFETGKIDSIILGIGVNCFAGSFPDELAEIAGALSADRNAFSRADLAAEIFNQTMALLHDMNTVHLLREYRGKCFILGKTIAVHPNLDKTAIRARAIDIDENGGLVVEYLEGRKARQMETLTTGEVSIRPEF